MAQHKLLLWPSKAGPPPLFPFLPSWPRTRLPGPAFFPLRPNRPLPQLSASCPAHVRIVPLTNRACLSVSSPPPPFPSSPSRQSLPLLRPPHRRRRSRCPWASSDLADPPVSFPHAPPFQKLRRRTPGSCNGRCRDPLPPPYHARNPRRDGVTHARPGSPPSL